MPWLALEMTLPEDRLEWWADALLDAGAISIDIADAEASFSQERPLYGEPGSSSEAAWPRNRVRVLFDQNTDVGAILFRLSAPANLPVFEISLVADRDWLRATKQQFGPIRISEHLWVIPSWCVPPRDDAVNLIMDPGLAFGTGSHPTTRLCLQWLEVHLGEEASVLDYGCGSGILAIAAAKLGAKSVFAVDIDDQALLSARENAERNGVSVNFQSVDRPLDLKTDVVLANILANPLRVLAPALASHVRDGGRIVLSGILNEQANEVIVAYSPWFNMRTWREDEGWVALVGHRLT